MRAMTPLSARMIPMQWACGNAVCGEKPSDFASARNRPRASTPVKSMCNNNVAVRAEGSANTRAAAASAMSA
jgi:hypothetical protein